jgi:hypothetical protein
MPAQTDTVYINLQNNQKAYSPNALFNTSEANNPQN